MNTSPRFLLATFLARLSAILIRLAGRKGTHTPGAIALKVCPDFLRRIARPKTLIAVTGTNGKTTTSNFLADAYKNRQIPCANNGYGSNLKEGVVMALLQASSFWGGRKIDTCILEVDERASRIIFPELAPDYLVVTNLFRESYKRNAHAEFIFRVLNDHIPASTHLILNADDPISLRLGKENSKTFFSIARLPGEASQEGSLIEDVPLCAECHHPLSYSFRRYHHIGSVTCEHCSMQSPKADFQLVGIDHALTVREGERLESYPLLGENIQDHYNELAALTLLRTVGFSAQETSEALAGISVVESRKQIGESNGVTMYRSLAKGMNPIAISRAITSVLAYPGKKAIVLLNDTSKKGHSYDENTAWLYDTDFELLNREDITQVLVGGYRAMDYYVRLLFAGVPEEKIVLCEEKAQVAEIIALEGIDFVGILYELYSEPVSRVIAERIRQRLEGVK